MGCLLMACKRSGVRIPIAPLPGQSIKFEQPLLTCLRPHEAWFSVPLTRPSAFSQFSCLAYDSSERLPDPLRRLQEASQLELPKLQLMYLNSKAGRDVQQRSTAARMMAAPAARAARMRRCRAHYVVVGSCGHLVTRAAGGAAMRPGRLRRARSARVGRGHRVQGEGAGACWVGTVDGAGHVENPGRACPWMGLLALPSNPSGARHASSHGRHRGTLPALSAAGLPPWSCPNGQCVASSSRHRQARVFRLTGRQGTLQ